MSVVRSSSCALLLVEVFVTTLVQAPAGSQGGSLRAGCAYPTTEGAFCHALCTPARQRSHNGPAWGSRCAACVPRPPASWAGGADAVSRRRVPRREIGRAHV